MKDIKTYANSFQSVSKLRLEGIGAICEKLGNPQKKLRYVHVAGTNGKGSVCAFLQNIFTSSGLKTGKFISPNMVDVCERISIDGKNISKDDMESILLEAGEKAKEVERETGDLPTQFEIWTAGAFLYFSRNKCDMVVLETGLGGRLDATNIIESPLATVITRIDIDHTEYLGDTIKAIAGEKAGIIKENTKVITSENQEQDALDVLRKKAEETHSDLFIAEKGKNLSHDFMTEIFDFEDFKDLKINLAGIHQIENATLAVLCAEKLGVEEKYIREGLFKARNIGRFELIEKNPMVIFDGAHNLSGTKALVSSLKRYFENEKITFIYGAMKDKDISASVNYLKESGYGASQVYTVQVKENPRSATAEALSGIFKSYGFDSFPKKDLGEALSEAKGKGMCVICGSLYLYKDLKAL